MRFHWNIYGDTSASLFLLKILWLFFYDHVLLMAHHHAVTNYYDDLSLFLLLITMSRWIQQKTYLLGASELLDVKWLPTLSSIKLYHVMPC